MPDELTIDELAQRAGTRTSTVRLYQTRGLLPGPEIRGRVGIYAEHHLARLQLIDRLQQRGFSLAAIRELLENWSRGATLATVLDPSHDLAGAGALAGFGEPAELTQDDFAALFPDGAIDPELVARAAAIGLVAWDPDRGTIRVPSRAFLAIGRELAAYRVPADRSVAEFEALAEDTRRIAERFVALFVEYVVAAAPPDPDAARATIDRFRGLAAAAVQELLAHALDELVTEAVPPPPA